jgi:hypothetical protein
LGVLLGGEAPQVKKWGFFKAEGLISGWVGKMKKNKCF